jgi:3-phosphoshikimate 1-carboxyvinyltransferase
MDVTVYPSKLNGNFTAPPSKSSAHRACIAAALAHGSSVIENVDLSSDITVTVKACEALGCRINIRPFGRYNTLIIDGGMKTADGADIFCADSGSTLRFMIPVVCTLDGKKTFSGSGRLPHRPIDEYLKIFDKQGIRYEKPNDRNLPLTVEGRFSGGEYVIDGGVSSQYITGLLFALPLLDGDSKITVTGNLESKGYVDMTLGTLRRFGVDIGISGNSYIIKGKQHYKPRQIAVESDYSQAAFMIAGAAINGDITINGLDPASLQPDRAMIGIMRRMGADIEQQGNALLVKRSSLNGIEVDVSQCPDLVPPIAAAAAFAQGTTRIAGASRLRVKESDRLHTLAINLKNIGITAEEYPDSLVIYGGTPRGGEIDSFGDHRIPMAFSIIALGSEAVKIKGAECVSKSWPSFFEDLKALGGKAE